MCFGRFDILSLRVCLFPGVELDGFLFVLSWPVFLSQLSLCLINHSQNISEEIMAEIQKDMNADALFVLPSQLNGAEYPSDTRLGSGVTCSRYARTCQAEI